VELDTSRMQGAYFLRDNALCTGSPEVIDNQQYTHVGSAL
jgi:hypothetical protein